MGRADRLKPRAVEERAEVTPSASWRETAARIRAGELTHEQALELDPVYARQWAQSESYRNIDWSDDIEEERHSTWSDDIEKERHSTLRRIK